MAGMNVAGGPVGGGPSNAQNAVRPQSDEQKRLNTYIYDYMLKNERYDLARQFIKSFEILKGDGVKQSPGRANGADDMDADSKEDVKKPADLPEPNIPHMEGSFLYDWWCQFWDIFGAHRQNGTKNSITQEYIQGNIAQRQNRAQGQQRLLNGGANPQLQGYSAMMKQNVLANPVLQRAMDGNKNINPQIAAQLQQQQQRQQMMQQSQMQMQREPSQMDMNGQARGSPAMTNAPSPSKRPRIDDGNFNGQPGGPAGRGQPLSGAQGNPVNAIANGPGGMLLQNGMTPEMQQQMASFQNGSNMQQKSMEGMNPGGMPQPGQMGMDGNMDFMNGRGMGQPGQAQPASGNHALQDYQMQLMLLEQQNKKRLLMARQEQENTTHPGPGGPTDPGNRGSPAPGANFDPSQMQQGNMPPQFYQQQMQQGAMMGNRPPSSHPGFNMQNMNPQQLDPMRQRQMMNGAFPPGGPQAGPQQMMMMQQQQPGGAPGQPGQPGQPPVQAMGTPVQRGGNMPPPPAPQSQEQQRTQPSSPAPSNAAPPTPSQAPKANPKGGKKEAAKPAKKNTKKGATGATPAAENAEPPTPTPSTPITPMHKNSFAQPNGNGQPPQPPNGSQTAPPAAQPAPVMVDPGMGLDADNNSFNMFDNNNVADTFNLDFNVDSTSDNVLDTFDFDALLNNQDFNFGAGDGGELGVGEV